MNKPAQLDVRDLHACYGKSRVLRGVSLAVSPGEIVSVLGRNGAGRSTLLKAIMGLVQADGEVRFGGKSVVGMPTHLIAQAGIAYVPECRDIFPSLSVEQNLLLGMQRGKKPLRRIDEMFQRFPQLAARRHVRAGVLSGGEQQLLTLCRALMGGPGMVMVDEPTEGLASAVVSQIRDLLLELQQCGISILLVEQKLAMALNISQRVYVIGHGRMVFEGTPEELKADTLVRKEWLEV
jgi:branched-chain amino acid transport system ATP-binding protein